MKKLRAISCCLQTVTVFEVDAYSYIQSMAVLSDNNNTQMAAIALGP